MLLALDDVHWADAASIEVMTHLSAPVPRAAADGGRYRHAPTRLVAALEGTARAASGSQIELAPLSREGGQAADRTHDMDEGSAREAVPRKRWQPLLHRAAGADRATQARSARPREPEQLQETVPRAVIAAIEEELITVSGPARLALQAAAVAGDPFEPELIAAIAETDTPAGAGRAG